MLHECGFCSIQYVVYTVVYVCVWRLNVCAFVSEFLYDNGSGTGCVKTIVTSWNWKRSLLTSLSLSLCVGTKGLCGWDAHSSLVHFSTCSFFCVSPFIFVLFRYASLLTLPLLSAPAINLSSRLRPLLTLLSCQFCSVLTTQFIFSFSLYMNWCVFFYIVLLWSHDGVLHEIVDDGLHLAHFL